MSKTKLAIATLVMLVAGGAAFAVAPVNYSGCADSDSQSTFDQNQLFTKATTKYNGGSKTDYCYTFPKTGKTYLMEGACSAKKTFTTWQKNCAELNYNNPGSDFKCVEGACVDVAPASTCTDSDGGKNYNIKGKVDGFLSGGQTHNDSDSCLSEAFGADITGKLREYYCDTNGYVNFEVYACSSDFHCYQGACQSDKDLASKGLSAGCTNPWALNYEVNTNAENDSCVYPSNVHIPKTPIFPLKDEKDLPPAYIIDDKILVIVPSGYEKYGQKMVEDLKYCHPLVSQFLGVGSYWDYTIVKVYVTNNNQTQGSFNPANGLIIYKKSQEILDGELKQLVNNDPEGFLFKSSPSYCSNSHEFAHSLITNTYIPGWANEGIVLYTQKFTKPGAGPAVQCQDNGWYGQDFWGDDNYKLFDYSDINQEAGDAPGDGQKWDRSAMCFWDLFNQQFGLQNMQKSLQLLKIKGDGSIPLDEQRTKFFIEKVLFPIVDKNDLKVILDKFGFVDGVDYTLGN